MKKNLYEVLGFKKDEIIPGSYAGVSLDEIKRAYKRMASKHHPDKGGAIAAFRAIEEAYRVLSDPEARARYHATGETEAPPDPLLKARDALLRLFGQVISDQSVNDPLSVMRAHLDKETRSAHGAKGANSIDIRRLETMSRKISKKGDGDNLIGAALQKRIGNLKAANAEIDGVIEDMRQMLIMLEEYEFTHTADIATLAGLPFSIT